MTSRSELQVFVKGIPAPQGSKRHVGGGRLIEASKFLEPWREAIARAVFMEWMRSGDDRPFTEPVVVYVTFYLPRPKSVLRLWPSGARDRDTDKLQRAIGDALSINAKAIADDSLIVKWRDPVKYWAATQEEAGARIYVRLATEDDLADSKWDEVPKITIQ